MEFSDVLYYFFHEKIHFTLEFIMLAILTYVLLKRPKRSKGSKLTDREVQELIDDWQPDPLFGQLDDEQKLDENIVVLESASGHKAVVNDKEVINLAAMNPLGLLGDKDIQQSAVDALRKYGCGSCGPRGFYGTIDVHLDVEEAIAKFVGTEQAILYSSTFACVASVIPTFAKRDDIIYCDRGANHAIQTGVALARSKVFYFAHNDIVELAKLMEKHAREDPKYKLKRRFVVVEGLYSNYGDIVELPAIMELKQQFCFYLMIDESHSFGVVGDTGRGVCELFDVDTYDIDISTASMGNTLCSIGGVCWGNNSVVTHQRLNGSGYVFSASLPPYLSCVILTGLKKMEHDKSRRATMKRYAKLARRVLSESKVLTVRCPNATGPYIHIEWSGKDNEERLANSKRLQAVVDECLKQGLLLTRAKYIKDERFPPAPSIRLCFPASMSEDEARNAVDTIVKVADDVDKLKSV